MKNCYVFQPEPDAPHHAVAVDLTGVGDMVPSTRTITRISAHRSIQGQGYGSEALRMVLADADAEGVHLSLEINPYGPLDYDDLVAWYRRYGFVPSKKYGGIYIRQARPCAPSVYGVITSRGVSYGFRCKKHQVAASDRHESRSAVRRAIRDHWRTAYRNSAK